MPGQRTGTFLVTLLVLAAMETHAGQKPQIKPAVPVDPIPAIVEAFQSHRVAAISDAHGNEQAQAFLISLVRDPRFSAVVNDIVVEFGSARYQDVMDRFVRGEDVPYDELRRVWQDTTQPSAGTDVPINEAFFRAVRAVNASLAPERRLRVLLGDPPIQWENVRNGEDHRKWIEMREWHPAAVIQLEVIAKGRRALLVYGHGHFQRKNILSNYDMSIVEAQTIVSLLETAGIPVFIVWRDAGVASVQPDAATWPIPSLARVKGTTLGAADFARYFSPAAGRLALRDGKTVPVPRSEWREIPAEEEFDAILYLGPPSSITLSLWSPALCADRAYMEMRLQRIALAGIPPAEAQNLQKHCASVVSK